MIQSLQIWRRKPIAASSHFGPTLGRVREMREHSDWEPLTDPSNIRQRADRLAETREHIKIPPLADQRETPKSTAQCLRTAMFWRPVVYPILCFVAFSVALFVILLKPSKPEIRKSAIVFSDVAHTNLSYAVAERFARRALGSAGLEASEWSRLEHYNYENLTIITFGHVDERFTSVSVVVKLEPGEGIVCTINPE